MSAFKGTPGPWQTDCGQHDAPYQDIRVQAGGHRICIVWIDDAPVPEYNATQEANARLIAAAPELLDALNNLVYWHAKRFNTNSDELLPIEEQEAEVQQAMRAIAKATGGAS
jgi:hypothetical protein